MRRMYSEQELTKIIGEVFDAKIEAGAFDDSISDAVDAYLVEHPVDITALEGKTIAPAVVNATTSISAPAGTFTSINGESNPSVKPIYMHPLEILDSGTPRSIDISMSIFNNDSAPFDTWAKLKQAMFDIAASVSGTAARFPVSGSFIKSNVKYIPAHIWVFKGVSPYSIRLEGVSIEDTSVEYIELNDLTLESFDGVNKIN